MRRHTHTTPREMLVRRTWGGGEGAHGLEDNDVGKTEDMGTIMEGDEEAHGPENNDAGGMEDEETPATTCREEK